MNYKNIHYLLKLYNVNIEVWKGGIYEKVWIYSYSPDCIFDWL